MTNCPVLPTQSSAWISSRPCLGWFTRTLDVAPGARQLGYGANTILRVQGKAGLSELIRSSQGPTKAKWLHWALPLEGEMRGWQKKSTRSMDQPLLRGLNSLFNPNEEENPFPQAVLLPHFQCLGFWMDEDNAEHFGLAEAPPFHRQQI